MLAGGCFWGVQAVFQHVKGVTRAVSGYAGGEKQTARYEDFDNDGDVDILVVNMNEPPSLLRNDVTGSGRWLKVLLVGVASNRSAIGARITARYGGRTQAQEVTAQSSFYSANDRRLHFGLGSATKADLTIRWPNGATEQADRLIAELPSATVRLANDRLRFRDATRLHPLRIPVDASPEPQRQRSQ